MSLQGLPPRRCRPLELWSDLASPPSGHLQTRRAGCFELTRLASGLLSQALGSVLLPALSCPAARSLLSPCPQRRTLVSTGRGHDPGSLTAGRGTWLAGGLRALLAAPFLLCFVSFSYLFEGILPLLDRDPLSFCELRVSLHFWLGFSVCLLLFSWALRGQKS